jgi:hypothetical protein
MDGRREALIVASYEFEDPSLRRLRAPGRDADALARVLKDPSDRGLRRPHDAQRAGARHR